MKTKFIKTLSFILISTLVVLNTLPLFSGNINTSKASYTNHFTVESNDGASDNHVGDDCGTPCTLRGAIGAAVLSSGSVLIDFLITDPVPAQDPDVIFISTILPKITAVNNPIVIDGGNQMVIESTSSTINNAFAIGDYTDVSGSTANNNVIKNITLTGFTNGIVIYGDDNLVQNVTIEGPNTLGVCDDTGQRGIAILARDGDGSPVGNTLLNNTITCYQKGIMTQMVGSTTISGNTLTNNTALETDLTTPDYNDDYVCHYAGIELQGGTGSTITNIVSNNTVTSNGTRFLDQTGPPCNDDLVFASAGIILVNYGLVNPASYYRITNNTITNNLENGMVLIGAQRNQILNNIIQENGTEPSDSQDPTSDSGNGIAFLCPEGSSVSVTANLVYHNTISQNADSGIVVGEECNDTVIFNQYSTSGQTILSNSIFENGRLDFVDVVPTDDGVGIDLQVNSGISGVAYTTNNAAISVNDGAFSGGGNRMVDYPVITSATSDGLGGWTVTGTGSQTMAGMVEVFEVNCASNQLPSAISTCDTATSSDTYGYGSGRQLLARGRMTGPTGVWTAIIPANAGFDGGLITATNTFIELSDNEDVCTAQADLPTVINALLDPGELLCDTSEFSQNLFVPAETNPEDPTPTSTAVFTKLIAPTQIVAGGTGTTILTLSNTGNQSFTNILITDDLAGASSSYVSGSCYWTIDQDPTPEVSNCSFTGDDIILDGTPALVAGSTLHVIFDFVVDPETAEGPQTNAAFVTVSATPPLVITPDTADFEVVAEPPAACETTGDEPNATINIDGDSRGQLVDDEPGIYEFAAGDLASGDAPLTFDWSLNGDPVSNDPSIILNLIAGTHVITLVMSDCDHTVSVETVIFNAATDTGGEEDDDLEMNQSVFPSADLHVGDLATVIIQLSNKSGQAITALTLEENMDGLSSLVPVCNYRQEGLPTPDDPTCTVDDGVIDLDLSDDPLQNDSSMVISFAAAVTGPIGDYNLIASYVSSTPTISDPVIPAKAPFTVVAGSFNPGDPEECAGSELVDAEFTMNGDATSTTTVSMLPGTVEFVNASTSGDLPVHRYWYVNNQLQTQSGSTLIQTISSDTTVTLLKVDCDGSTDADSILITITPDSPEPTPTATPTPTPTPTPTQTSVVEGGVFTVEKTITQTTPICCGIEEHDVEFTVTIINNSDDDQLHRVENQISNQFSPVGVVTVTAGGTNNTTTGIIDVSDIIVPANSSRFVKYTLQLLDLDHLPLSGTGLRLSADADDEQFYAEKIKSTNVAADEDNILSVPDGKLTYLVRGDLSTNGVIVLDTGRKSVIVDHDGDDFGLALAAGTVKVYVSQDGRDYDRITGKNSFDLSDTDFSWIRYIKIQGTASQFAATTVTPAMIAAANGAAIDAVCFYSLGVPVSDTSTVTSGDVIVSNTVATYADLTDGFDDAPTNCRAKATVQTRQARTLELPTDPPVPFGPQTPPPAPVFGPEFPVQVELPKTGPVMPLAAAVAFIGSWMVRKRKRQ
jgi:parallel beta-helix repeat protein